MIVRCLVAVAAVAALAAPALAGTAAAPAGGVQGIVKQPETGMCLAGDPCDGIARGVVLVFTKAGRLPRRVRSGTDGRFRIRLAAGRYHVRGAAAGTRASPASIAVPTRGFARVTITLLPPAASP
jgi:hypothetical protein